MERIPYSTLCRNLDFNMDWVCNGGGPLLITRRNAGNVVLISAEDYEGLL
jgi:prevent-host-death family protein